MIEGEQERELLREKEGKKTDGARERDIDGGRKKENLWRKRKKGMKFELIVRKKREQKEKEEKKKVRLVKERQRKRGNERRWGRKRGV